jgi:hypothetical protein
MTLFLSVAVFRGCLPTTSPVAQDLSVTLWVFAQSSVVTAYVSGLGFAGGRGTRASTSPTLPRRTGSTVLAELKD